MNLQRLILLSFFAAISSVAELLDYPLVNLSDGHVIPQLGVGLGGIVQKSKYQSLLTAKWALELGVRMIDTAAAYNNEEQVHDAIQESGLSREDIFISTKLDEEEHGFREAYEALEEALEEELQMDYVDLFLIHSPDEGKVVETWDALIALQEDGKARSIGVSNFGIHHLEAIRQARRPMPVVNQIEMHPLIYQQRKDLVEYCEKHDIQIIAFGSLFSGLSEFYDHPTLQSIAQRTSKTVPQILLRWAVDHGFIVIPTSSSSQERLKENYDILDFELTLEEIQQMDQLDLSASYEFTFENFEERSRYWKIDDEEEVDVGDLNLAAELRNSQMRRERNDEEL